MILRPARRPETRTRGVDRASDGRSPLPPELPRDRHLYVVGDGPELLSSRGDHVEIRQLAEDFARYPYLPRLAEPAVLMAAIRDGLSLLTWRQDSFAYADAYDEAAGRYRGLRCGQLVTAMA